MNDNHDIGFDLKSKGEYVPEVIYVNGNRQVSASNPEYHNPVLP